jgi:hypothetical protein
MIRFLSRFIGLWILAAGFVFLVYDGTKSIAGNAVFITRLLDTWNMVHATSLAALQPLIESHLAWLWDPVFTSVLNAPTWGVFGVLGAVLILLGRRKKPLIGYARG